MDVDLELIAKSMGTAVPYIRHMGMEVTAMEVGAATALLPDRPELHNHVGSQHAGALFGVAETASGAAFVGSFAARVGDVTPLARPPGPPPPSPPSTPTVASTSRSRSR